MKTADVIIRSATASDLPVMSVLIRRAIRERNSADYTPEQIEISCAKFSEEGLLMRLNTREVFVATREERIVGTVSIAGGKLYSLFIDPDFQKLGLGMRLVGFIERLAIQRGHEELCLSAALTARGFYEKLGYETAAREERPEGATWLMTKRMA